MRPVVSIGTIVLVVAIAGCAQSATSDVNLDPSASPSQSVTGAAAVDLDSPLEVQLSDAVRAGDVELTQALVDAGADLEAPLAGDMTALQIASSRGDAATAEVLVAGGAEVDAGSANGSQALAVACRQDQPEVIAYLLEAGADPAVLGTVDQLGRAPIHWCAQGDSAEGLALILDTGLADVDHGQGFDGATPLAVAAFEGNFQAAEFLLDNGADPHFEDERGQTVLGWARTGGEQAVLDLLCVYGACEA